MPSSLPWLSSTLLLPVRFSTTKMKTGHQSTTLVTKEEYWSPKSNTLSMLLLPVRLSTTKMKTGDHSTLGVSVESGLNIPRMKCVLVFCNRVLSLSRDGGGSEASDAVAGMTEGELANAEATRELRARLGNSICRLKALAPLALALLPACSVVPPLPAAPVDTAVDSAAPRSVSARMDAAVRAWGLEGCDAWAPLIDGKQVRFEAIVDR